MKMLMGVFVLLLIAVTTVSGFALNQTYLPIVMKSLPSATATPTPTPTTGPGTPPEITYLYCNYLNEYVYCWLDVKNVGARPISNVIINIYYDGIYARQLDSGSGWIQPGEIYGFTWSDHRIVPPNTVMAQLVSWIEH
jgi:hypothetical protein